MAMSAKHVPWIVIIVWTGIGVVVTAISVAVGWSSWKHLSGAERTGGVVVELIPDRPGHSISRDEAGPVPVVEYRVDGQTYRIRGHFAPQSLAYRVGEKVVVAYPPGQPSEGRIDSFGEMWLAPLAFGGVGSVLALSGFAMIRSRLRSPRPATPGARASQRSRQGGVHG